MPKAKLTEVAIQRYKADPGGRIDYFDATLPGFSIRVSGPTPRNPLGNKSWVLFYRFGGAQKRLTLQPGYPAMGLAAARKQASEAFQKIARGEDPAAEKREMAAKAARRPDTVENVVDDFIRRYMEGKKRAPRYIAETRRNFDNHVLPRWRGRDLKTIARRDIIDLLDAIVDEGKAVAANRVLAAVRKMFNWAIQRGLIEASPVAMVEAPGAETKRDRALSGDELATVWDAAETVGYPFGPYFRLAIATGQRRQEVARIRWSDINVEARTWTIPADETKPGRTHVVPLSPVAMKILKECPRIGAYVFTTRGDRPVSGYSRAKLILDKAVATILNADAETDSEPTKLAPWTIHDLRRTSATGLGRLGSTRFVIARVLNHADSTVTGIYDRHEYLEEKRQALEAWGRYLEGLGQTAPAAAQVAA